MRELLACTFTPFWAGFVFARTSCVRVYTLLGRFRVRENFLRARLHRFGQVSCSRELLACAFTPFWAGFAFARTSCVRVYTVLGRFRVRENFLRARLHRFGQVSCSRELLACAFTPFWTGFAFARTSCVRVYTLLDGFRVCENFLRARLHPFERVLRSRELLACTFTPFWAGFVFARTSCVHVYTLLSGFYVRENFLRARLHQFCSFYCFRARKSANKDFAHTNWSLALF
jgi:hypothetical protein